MNSHRGRRGHNHLSVFSAPSVANSLHTFENRYKAQQQVGAEKEVIEGNFIIVELLSIVDHQLSAEILATSTSQ